MNPINDCKEEVKKQIEFWQSVMNSLEAAEKIPSPKNQATFLENEIGIHIDPFGLICSPRIVESPIDDLDGMLAD